MILGLILIILIILTSLFLGMRDQQMANRAIQRYAQSLTKKEKKDEKDFIFVDPDKTESLRKQSIEYEEEEREEDELTEESYDLMEDLM